MKNRTWPVFLLGLGTLLLLIFLPGLAALEQSAGIFEEIRAVQREHETTQLDLAMVESGTMQASLLVRDFVLDSSPEASPRYKAQFRSIGESIHEHLAALARRRATDAPGLARLQDQVSGYLGNLQPVFEWTPEQRAAQGTYFLREQQRPRRDSVLAIAEQIGALVAANYRQRYLELETSQRTYRKRLGSAVAITFLLGVAVAVVTSGKIALLEKRAVQHQQETERAEHEMRSLSGRLMQVQEEERRTISRELHDEVGQNLTALRLELGALERLRASGSLDFATHLEEAKALSEQALRTVRDIAVGLRPSVLDLGLGPALQWQARQFSKRTGVEARVQVDESLPAIPDEYATCIYRIVQEALTNCVRHAQAKCVHIEVAMSDRALRATVRDDGVGLRNGWDKGRGLGLVGMEERARELGGTVAISSEGGRGTTITVRLPAWDRSSD